MIDPRDAATEKQFDFLLQLYPNAGLVIYTGQQEFGEGFDLDLMTKHQASRLIEIRKAINEGRTPEGRVDPNLTMEGLL